ncbi:hypothetical protein G5I_03188 [Acromyrmex echinatior]|uniref:Uncharacterized protein n=1 Tax=Acromyrmex echinatior TaxID=103372 RepID=F4WCB4_ACREC|nr:hypothetical protein G5I_03188 [Acromyrmex echinatior]
MAFRKPSIERNVALKLKDERFAMILRPYSIRDIATVDGSGGGGPVIYNAITLVFTAVSNQGDNLVTN